MKNRAEKNSPIKPPHTSRLVFFVLGSIILLLTAVSAYLFLENKELGGRYENVSHEAEILNAEVPDPVIKYSPLLVGSGEPVIKELADSLGGPEQIYLFVRDKIDYSEEYDQQRSAVEVLRSRQGDCLGKANLLAGLLLAYGYSHDEVEVNMGYVNSHGERMRHAWVELKMNGKWMVLDSSKFLSVFDFDRWDRESFYKIYNAEPYAEFNDQRVYVNLGKRIP